MKLFFCSVILTLPFLGMAQFNTHLPKDNLLINQQKTGLNQIQSISSTKHSGSRTQRSNASKAELGPMIGGTYYTGELNRMGHFKQVSLAAGLMFRYNINPRLAIRASGFYGTLKGADSKQKSAFAKNRNLSFKSTIVEVGAGIEFNYYQYQMRSREHAITTYMFFELAGFYMNPKTNYNGQWVELQPLGTEGQGNNGKKKYAKYQLSIPFGLGVKFNLWKGACMSFEYGLRLTFTDYIDDVSGKYFDNNKLRSLNGPIAANLADRSLKPLGLNSSNTGYKRGNSNDNDWYGFFNVMITFQLGRPNTCWMF